MMLKREIRRFLASSVGVALCLTCAATPIMAKASYTAENRIKKTETTDLVKRYFEDSDEDEGDYTIDTGITYYDFNLDETSSEEEHDYEYDVLTGLPIDSEITDTSTNLMMSDNCYFDTETKEFVYSVENNVVAVRATVAEGMIVSDAVEIKVMDGISYTLYKDGEPMEDGNLNLTHPGAYVFEVAHGSGTENLFSFKIIGTTSNLDYYDMPEGFTVLKVLMGEDYADFDDNMVKFTNEEHYIVTYRMDATNEEYMLQTTIDKTAPTLELSEVNDKNRASKAVDISDLEDGCKISIYLDGKQIDYTNKLTDSGQYTITLEDEAGNISNYSFTIMLYFTTGSIVFLLVIFLLVVGLVVYVTYSKKHMRIR